MAAPTAEQTTRLGPAVMPFERGSGEIFEGEAIRFNAHIFKPTEGDLPLDCVKTSVAVIHQQDKAGRYLWVIDQSGLKIMREAIPNPFASRGCMCHTNITGGAPALQGGELWFGEDNKVYVNNKSGRYGAENEVQRAAVIEYFTSIGYDLVQLPTRRPTQ